LLIERSLIYKFPKWPADSIKLCDRCERGLAKGEEQMRENQNRPREYDAVLGGKNPPPVNAAVLGGIEGAKKRLTASDELVRVGAVRDAMKYGEAGLDVAIASLENEFPQVRREAMYLLQAKLTHPKVNAILANGKLMRIYPEEFETVSVTPRGTLIDLKPGQAEIFATHLGDGVELEMVFIPGGNVLMGSQENERGIDYLELLQHRARVSPFFLGRYPVTQEQYEVVMGKNRSYFKGANRPVEQVTWHDATEFCWRLSQKTGRVYRLPSEAEWEYACRGGTTTPFSFGETITTDLVNYNGKLTYRSAPKGVWRKQTTDVGSFPPNAFGLYDMHGNVWEWCQDVWHRNYNGAPTDGSAWETGGRTSIRVVRGGSWDSNPINCCSAYRSKSDFGLRTDYGGFRVVMAEGL
jgi:formylglycine-generating enzyme required for sulfatase activity